MKNKKIELLKERTNILSNKIKNINECYDTIVKFLIENIKDCNQNVKIYNDYAKLLGLSFVKYSDRTNEEYCVIESYDGYTHRLTEYVNSNQFMNVIFQNSSFLSEEEIDLLLLGFNKFINNLNEKLLSISFNKEELY